MLRLCFAVIAFPTHTGSLHTTTDKPQAAFEACISTLCLASWDSEVTVKLAGPWSWLDGAWTMKLAGELVGMKPLPSFTAAWWGETKRPVRLQWVLTTAEIVVGFTDRLTHLGAASALLAGTALSVVRQRQAAGPVQGIRWSAATR
jgi:hypothetical protein